MYSPTDKKFYIFAGSCIAAAVLLIVSPFVNTSDDSFGKLRYQGKFNLAISNYETAAENFYQASLIAESEIYGISSNSRPDQQINQEHRETVNRIMEIQKIYFDKEALLDVRLSLAYIFYKLGFTKRMDESLQKAMREFPNNRFVYLAFALRWTGINRKKAEDFFKQAAAMKKMNFEQRNKLEIYSLYKKEALAFTNQKAIDKAFSR